MMNARFPTLLIACVLASGCMTSVYRAGPTLPLPSGEARNECERDGWYELAEAEGEAWASQARIVVVHHSSVRIRGHGVFRADQDYGRKVGPLLERMEEPALAERHMQPVEEVDSAQWQKRLWVLGGTAVLVGGVVVAADADHRRDGTTTAIAASVGVGAFLTGLIVGMIVEPSVREQHHAERSRYLFMEGRDDMDAVRRGVNRLNEAQRVECESP